MKLGSIVTAENHEAIADIITYLFEDAARDKGDSRDALGIISLKTRDVALAIAAVEDGVPEHISDYLKIGGVRCPYPDCNTLDISGGGVDITEYGAEQSVVCIECSRTWTDHYNLVGVTLDEPVEDGV